MKVLVTGAGAPIGRAVANLLVAANAPARSLVEERDTGGLPGAVELVEGNLADPTTLGRAFEGVDRLFLAGDPWSVPGVMIQAAGSGVGRVVLLSSASAPWERVAPRPQRYFLPAEQAVEASGLAWTHLRPVGLMAAALARADSIRREGIVRQGFAAAGYPHVHEGDVAAVAAAALLEEGHAGARYLMTGPSAITVPQQVATLAAALGREIVFQELTEEEAIAQWRSEGWDEDSIDIELIALGEAVQKSVRPRPTVERILGRPALSFSEWARENVEAFR